MSNLHQAINEVRKQAVEVVSLRELGRRSESGRFVSTGLDRLDRVLDGEGLPAGSISELCGPSSSGKSSLVTRIMADITGKGGCVAYLDYFDVLSPEFLQHAGVDLENLLWIRGTREEDAVFCREGTARRAQGNISGQVAPGSSVFKRVIRQVEILIQSGNFSLVILDLAEPSSFRGYSAPAVPGGAWFRLQRAAEKSGGTLLLLSGRRLSSGAAARVLSLESRRGLWGGGKFSAPGSGPAGDLFRKKEKRALLLGMEGSVSVLKGGAGGGSILFHCHL